VTEEPRKTVCRGQEEHGQTVLIPWPRAGKVRGKMESGDVLFVGRGHHLLVAIGDARRAARRRSCRSILVVTPARISTHTPTHTHTQRHVRATRERVRSVDNGVGAQGKRVVETGEMDGRGRQGAWKANALFQSVPLPPF